MIRHFKVNLQIILIALLFTSCSSVKIAKQDNRSIIAISAKSFGFLSKGYGISITMQNIETHETFSSEPVGPMSAHSIIQNIPPGKYYVTKIVVPVGNAIYSYWYDSIKTFFGEITIEANKKYYLGDFSGRKQIGNLDELKFCLKGRNIPNQLKAKIENEKTGWSAGEFIDLFPKGNEEEIQLKQLLIQSN